MKIFRKSMTKRKKVAHTNMAKKERSHDPAGAQRKLDRKNELKKFKKQRLERKEQLFESDPKALKAEIARLKHLTELRSEAGTNKKMHEKIEELSAVLQEAERRRAAGHAGPERRGEGGGGAARMMCPVAVTTYGVCELS